MAAAAVIALVHDLVATAGIYALTGFEVTPASVIGFLTILGYSLYDTVVVFDKIRENTAHVFSSTRRTYADAVPLRVREGASARLRISNRSMMSHPVHLHGHTFAVRGSGLRKDTLLVPAMTATEVDLLADNPGAWMLHCHNAFHMEAGMMTRLDYTV